MGISYETFVVATLKWLFLFTAIVHNEVSYDTSLATVGGTFLR
jgi:hypothetical protein